MPASGDGYVWTGDLAETRVNALYATCHALRFTGRLELRDASHHAQVVFIGGDPVEIEGGDTQVIALWSAGTFRANQSLPNLAGEITDQVEQTGSLAVTKAPRLLAWVSEYRLSCELFIERPGEEAVLSFKNGQLESAHVNKALELSALARVQAWTDGFYRVRLRPLFVDGVSMNAPPSEGAAPAGRAFDVSRSIPLDLKERAATPIASPAKVTFGNKEMSIEAERSGMQRALPAVATPITLKPPVRVERAVWPYFVLGVAVVAAGALAAMYTMHLPPFSPPPRVVIDEPKPTPQVIVDAAQPVLVDAAQPRETPDLGVVAKQTSLEPQTPEGKATPTQALDARLIDKGRLLLIDGHPHSALDLFKRAEQANAKNPLAKLLEQEALGKLGRAEISIERGRVVVDGKTFEAGKKLKVFAGPHAIDTGSGVEEVTLKKGEHRKLRARP